MAGPSKIQWCEHTWNPIVGCSIVSPGCTNCYAMSMAARIEAMNKSLPVSPTSRQYDGTTKRVNGHPVWTGTIALAPESVLLAPLKRKKPTTYFVNSMGDLFHEDAPDEWIDKVFAVMALAPQHTFQVLTKRAERMRNYFAAPSRQNWAKQVGALSHLFRLDDWTPARATATIYDALHLPNVWLGVSTERQQEADERIPLLLQTPAAVRFISAEPLLGPIDLLSKMAGVNAMGNKPINGLDWVIVGGESGHGARPMHPEWVRSLRQQCLAKCIPFFFKQWGNWTPGENVERQRGIVDTAHWFDNRWCFETENLANCEGHVDDQPDVYCVGKKEAGRKLDGIEHNAMPQLVSA